MNEKETQRIYQEHKVDHSMRRGLIVELLGAGLGVVGLFVVLPYCVRLTRSLLLGFLLFMVVGLVGTFLFERFKKSMEEKNMAEWRSNEELMEALQSNNDIDEKTRYDKPMMPVNNQPPKTVNNPPKTINSAIKEPSIEYFDEETERKIKALFNYCAKPALSSPSETVVDISYVKRSGNQSSLYQGRTLRKWRIIDGEVSLIDPSDSASEFLPFTILLPDGSTRRRIFVDFSFHENVAHIGYQMDHLFGYGYAYDFSVGPRGGLKMKNKREEWIS